MDDNSFQLNIEDNIELRKAIVRLEDIISKKHTEYENLLSLYEDMKQINEKTKKECLTINEKYMELFEDKRKIEKYYESEVNKLRSNFEKEKEKYDKEILKNSAIDIEIIKKKITSDIELNYKSIIKEKELNIDLINEEYFNLKKKYDIMCTEYECFKLDILKEIENKKEIHKNEVRDLNTKIYLLNEKYENNNEKENYKRIKQEVDSYRRNFSDLHDEINVLRRDKENLLTEKNEIKLLLMKELDKEKLKSSVLSSENEKNTQLLKLIENENIQMKNIIDEKNNENKILINDKYNLLFEIKEKEREHEVFRSELKYLKQIVDEREKEVDDQLKYNHDREKHRLISEKNEKENYESLIDELRVKLKETQTELKFLLENRRSNPQDNIDKINDLVKENEKLRLVRDEKIDSNEVYELKILLKAKNDEIVNLNSIIKMLKDDQSKSYTYQEKIKRDKLIQELKNRKNHYKEQCIIHNQRLQNIITKIRNKEEIDIKSDDRDGIFVSEKSF